MTSLSLDDTALIERIGKKRYRRRLERERYYTQGIDLSGMATTTAGSKLAQEINEEFLTCKICLEPFKSPKCLDCLHTFCELCIDNHVMSECTYKKYSDYREFTCPLCRKRTQLPIGGVKKLPDNFLVSSLSEVVLRQKPSKFPFCDICKLVNRKHREASSKCLDCNKLLCKQCVDLHKETKVTKSHSLFDVEIEKDIECKEHSEEVVRFYCEPCEMCICVLCTFNEHKDHEITQFNEAVLKYKEAIQTLLSSCKDRIDVYDSQLAHLKKCETIIKAAEQRIRDVAIQFISDIRNREKSLIDELHEIYGEQVMDYVARRGDMQVNLDSLKSTCNLTELVLKGKDIELLLLKKQVQEKLSCLSAIELEDLPDSVHKEVTFSPGCLELGYIDDPDVPTRKSPRAKPRGSNLHIRTIETQTDPDSRFEKPKQCNRALQANSYDIENETASQNDTPVDDKNTSTDITIDFDGFNNQNKEDESNTSTTNSPPDANSSPVPRRQRRRRERKPVEEDDNIVRTGRIPVFNRDKPEVKDIPVAKVAPEKPQELTEKDRMVLEKQRELERERSKQLKREQEMEQTRSKEKGRRASVTSTSTIDREKSARAHRIEQKRAELSNQSTPKPAGDKKDCVVA